MLRLFVWTVACFLFFTSCTGDEEDSSLMDGDTSDGDSDTSVEDGDEEPLPDGDTLEDGDDEPSDGDEPDGDEDGDTLEDGDEDGDSVDTEDDVEQTDGDGESCGEWELAEFGEDEERPQWQITSLWETAQIVACEAPVEGTTEPRRKDSTWTTTSGSNEAWAYAVWSDGADVVLFGDERGLWRYEESPTPTLRCDPTTPGTVYTLQGTGTGSSAVVWAGLTGQVARLENREWTVETLPAPLTGPVLALVVDGTRIAAQTLEGVAVRKESGWEMVAGCESFDIAFPENSPVETGQAAATGMTWHDDKLYVGAVEALLEIDPQAGTCRALCTWATPENAAPLRFVVQGHCDCGLWATVLEYREEPFLAETSPFTSIGICQWNGAWQETIGEIAPLVVSFIHAGDGTPQALLGQGNADGWVTWAISQNWVGTMGGVGTILTHRLSLWPSGSESEVVTIEGELSLDCTSDGYSNTCLQDIPCTIFRPADFWLYDHVGYYSPGFSKVTFGE